MGNCQSNNVQHVRVNEPPQSFRDDSQLKKPSENSDMWPSKAPGDPTEASNSSYWDTTASPSSTASTTLSLTPESLLPPPLHGLDEEDEEVSTPKQPSPRVLYEMPSSSPKQNQRRSPRKGRALQARLDKARSLQIALNSGSALDGNGSICNTVTEDRELEVTYSMGDSTVITKESLKDEFEATISRGTIWQELPLPQASAVAFSRHEATLDRRLPELLLASGTNDGRVLIHTLHSTGSINAPPEQRLSHPIELVREGRVRSLDFSKNGRYLAVGGDDGMAAVYELYYDEDNNDALLTAGLVAEISRVDRVYSVRFRPDSAYLAVGGFDGCVAIVDTQNKWETVVEIVRDDLIYCVDWSPDSQYLAIGGSDKLCAIVPCAQSWKVAVEVRRSAIIQSLRWHPNGRSLAIGANDVAIVERDNWQIRHEVAVSTSSEPSSPRKRLLASARRFRTKVQAMCWSPNGSYLLVSGSDAKTCSLLESKRYTVIHEIERDSTICAVAWGEQSVLGGIPSRYIGIGTRDAVVVLKAGLELRSSASSMGDDMSSNPSTASSYFSTRGSEWEWKENNFKDVDGGTLAISNTSQDEVSNVQPEVQRPPPTSVRALCFSRGSKSRPSAFYAVATDDGNVTVRSTIGWKVLTQNKFVNPIRCCAFSNGSRFLALGGEDAKVFVMITVPSWSIAAEISFSAPITCLAFSKNNERLVVGSLDGALTFLDGRSNWEVIDEVLDNESPVLSLDWSSRNLVIGRHDGTITVYDSVQIFRRVLTKPYSLSIPTPVRAVAFGVSSRFLIVGGDNGMVNVFSAKGGWELCQEIEEDCSIGALRWSPTGRYVAYSGENGLFKMIDTLFWTESPEASDRQALPMNEGKEMCHLAFSQDGNLVACGPKVIDTRTWSHVLDLSYESDSEGAENLSLTSYEASELEDVGIVRNRSAEI